MIGHGPAGSAGRVSVHPSHGNRPECRGQAPICESLRPLGYRRGCRGEANIGEGLVARALPGERNDQAARRRASAPESTGHRFNRTV
jgi:hypothetical protein